MKPMLDIQKVKAALNRAAYKAIHGTRMERSGRFLLSAKPVSKISKQRNLSRPKA